ncbi:MAG: peroxidase [Chloroflexi bacterium]|nr:MAG: peroxidase [Chloroflexota bacterium]
MLEPVAEDEAEGDLAEFYRSRGGQIAHILRSNSLNPPVLRAHDGLYRAIMFGPSPLGRAQREMVATVVSLLNQCHY